MWLSSTDNLEEFTQLLWEASETRKCCRIQLRGGFMGRTVEPYGICRTTANKIVLVCWQSMGFTKPGGTAGFRNLILEDIVEAEIIEREFTPQTSFNPKDTQYKEWVYHLE